MLDAGMYVVAKALAVALSDNPCARFRQAQGGRAPNTYAILPRSVYVSTFCIRSWHFGLGSVEVWELER